MYKTHCQFLNLKIIKVADTLPFILLQYSPFHLPYCLPLSEADLERHKDRSCLYEA